MDNNEENKSEEINEEVVEETSSSTEGTGDESDSLDLHSIDGLKQALAKSEEEVAKNRDLAMRNQAEVENVRKRSREDVEKAHKFATEKFAKELLSIADNFELGLKAAEENATVESLLEGTKLIQQQLFKVFENMNIESIETEGEVFNPELHEAITMIPNPDLEDNTVVDVVQKGYTLNGRLLRPSKVVVSKKD